MAPNVSAIENNIAFKFLICFLYLFNIVLSFVLTYSCRVLIFMYIVIFMKGSSKKAHQDKACLKKLL